MRVPMKLCHVPQVVMMKAEPLSRGPGAEPTGMAVMLVTVQKVPSILGLLAMFMAMQWVTGLLLPGLVWAKVAGTADRARRASANMLGRTSVFFGICVFIS